MSGSSGQRPPLRLVRGGRSAAGSEHAKDDLLAAVIARGVSASGHDDELAETLARTYLEQASAPRPAHPNAADPLARHELGADRVEGDRGGPPAAPLYEGVLGAAPTNAPGTLPSPAPTGRSLEGAEASPQAHHRARGGASREARDRRRERRRKYDRERMDKLGDALFAKVGQARDVPDPPPLLQQVRGLNLRMMQDGTGRKAREVLAKLPYTQALAVCELAFAALPWHQAGRLSAFTRQDYAAGVRLPADAVERERALEQVRDEIAPTLWFRKLVAAAYGMWGHRGRPLSAKAQQASRGGVYLIEGFCQNALSYLVPQPDGTRWSRSALWGPTGPFSLLGAAPRQLGRAEHGPAGVGLWTRWQPPAGVARFKGPTKVNPKTGAIERFALASVRYLPEMCGRTAASLARRGRGVVREASRLLTEVMTPWLTPGERKRVPVKREEGEADAPASPVEAPTATPEAARAPP